jgi:hypothetical protein
VDNSVDIEARARRGANAGVGNEQAGRGVHEAHLAGASLRDVAAESGMSHMIERIVEREAD